MRIIKYLLVICLLSSCAKKTIFTSSLREECALPENKLKKIQFYTSEEIILYKTKEKTDASVKNGKIFLETDKDCEKIIIKKNTPCVLEKELDKNKMLFSFEYGEGKVLLFGNSNGGQFSLMAKEWKDKIGVIEYGTNTYVTNSGTVFLVVNAKKLKRLKDKYRIVSGRKI
jgi:hypothetical protein